MDTRAVTPERLAASVIAVPPLARDGELAFSRSENERLIRHIEAGGVTTLLYGGNANFYHIRRAEYATILGALEQIAAPGTLVTPAAGPAFGTMMDQADVLREFAFPTVMVLPHTGLQTFDGVATGLRRFAERLGKPIVVYIKAEGYLTPRHAAALVADGIVSWVKYAIVRDDPAEDSFLADLVQFVDPRIVVSGIGEQPALVHMRKFGCGGFTTGCGCVAPRLSQAVLTSAKAGAWGEAERLRESFRPLEDLRNEINPVRVLHEAVEQAGIAATGPHLPLLSGLADAERERVRVAAAELLSKN